MENKKELELRMYGWVPYNISEIQKGIQFGHAVDQYAREFVDDNQYQDWVDNHKTYIILNGGTTNNNRSSKWFGSLNQILDTLVDNEIQVAAFHEPDLGDQLTGVVLIADERCFNHKDYPTFMDYMNSRLSATNEERTLWLEWFKNGHEKAEEATNWFIEDYQEWTKLIGGTKNAFLKTFLRNFKLA